MMPKHPLVEFRPSRIDRTGGFARAPILNGARVIEYVGERISKQESIRRCQESNAYIFCLDDELDLDGNVEQNPARFLNHSCDPNCEARLIDDHVWIVAVRDIEAGEELTFNYGYDLEDYRDYPCRCGAPDCDGYIVAEEFFPQIRNRAQHAWSGRG